MNKAPWKDFNGEEIYEGSVIAHPSGQRGTIVYKPEREAESDQWLVDYGTGYESRLCLQIGDKGRAIKI